MQTASSGDAAIAAAVSIKVPPFIQSQPGTWFLILEAQFNIASITTATTRFYHALSNLPVDTVSNLDEEVLRAADYDALKEAVKKYHEQSRGEVFESFLRSTPLTGKPSHYLMEMRKMAKKVGVGEEMVRHRFQQALPANLAPVIATQKTLPLDDLGALADELVPLLKGEAVCAVTPHPPHENKPRQAYKPAGSSKSLTLVPFAEGQLPKVCRSHLFFGAKARNCRPWCQWPDKATCNVTQSRAASPATSRSASPSRTVNK